MVIYNQIRIARITWNITKRGFFMKFKLWAFLAVVAAGLTTYVASLAVDVKTFKNEVWATTQREPNKLLKRSFLIDLPEDGLVSDILPEILKNFVTSPGKGDSFKAHLTEDDVAYMFFFQSGTRVYKYLFSAKPFTALPKKAIDLMSKKLQNKSLKSLGIGHGTRIYVVFSDIRPA